MLQRGQQGGGLLGAGKSRAHKKVLGRRVDKFLVTDDVKAVLKKHAGSLIDQPLLIWAIDMRNVGLPGISSGTLRKGALIVLLAKYTAHGVLFQ